MSNKFTLSSKIKEILKDERAVQIIEEYIPGASKHPQLYLVKNWSAEKALGMAHLIGVTNEQKEDMQKRIEALQDDGNV